MIDDLDLALEPNLAPRWEVIRCKLEENAESLLTQGGLASKVTGSGRRAWAVRFVDRSGAKPAHRSLYLGDDERLVDLVRRQLDHYRLLGRFPDEIAGHARFAVKASHAVRHLAAGRLQTSGRPVR